MPRLRVSGAAFDIPDGEVFIHLAGRPDLVWDMTGYSQQAGGRALLWQRHGGANQRWRVTTFFDEADNPYTWFRIINVHSGMALVHRAENDALVQQPAAPHLSREGWSQVWAIDYPGRSGSSLGPAKPSQPHPTGSDGVRLRFKGEYISGKLITVTPETSGTHLSS
ncbi:RICIN domain-containing protein, partial [Streptomyces tsukubensis]|uniref:RICIN domain-containing protein n=1 Tax=Streptomyces tsukubensis TaxID=83656 RepID=UPI00344D7BF0